MMDTATSIAALRARVAAWRREGESVGLVPTMGALHAGHLTLVRRARALASHTVVTLFVNPTQFGPGEDYGSYPRDEARDRTLLEAEGVDLLFVPSVAEMYPPGHVARVRVPGLGDVLEGEFRPGFFEGVATIVTKLLLQALPDVALFGEKDYQQLRVIERLVSDLDVPVRIEGVPTVREPDGLALSSRNAYLTAPERAIAPTLHRVLQRVAEDVERGEEPERAAASGVRELERAGFGKVDYLTARDADTLQPMRGDSRAGRVLAAARLGRARLIDNVPVREIAD